MGDEIDLAATSSSGLLVTFTSSDAAIAEIGTGDKAGKLILKTAGTATITASQAGDVTYAPASFMQTIVVSKKTQNLSFNLAQNVVNRNVPTLMLTASSDNNTLPIVFSLENQMTDAGGTGNVATIMDNMDGTATLTLVATGTVTVTASQAGNDVYNTASISHTLTVTDKMLQMITFMLAPTGLVGDEIGLMATSSSGLPVTLTSSDAAIAEIGTGDKAGKLILKTAGTATITASQAGDETYAPASAMQNIVVSKKTQTLSFTLASTGLVGKGINLSATTDAMGLNVSFAINPPAGVATLVDNNDGSGMLTLTAEGTVIVTASQAGNETYAPASAMQTIVVSKKTQTLSFTLASTGSVGDGIPLSATTDATGLNVSFAINPPAGVATLVDNNDGSGMLTLTAEGTVIVTASQAGNETYAAATDVMQTITVGPVLGIEDAVDDFVLYPNPVSGKLHFSEQVGQFRLYGIEGRLLETRENVRSVDLTARPPGLYFAEVIRGERSVRYRIVRE